MIHVKRVSVEIPECLDGPDCDAAREKEKAIEYYEVTHANTPGVPKSYAFSVYSNKTVKTRLNNLFTFKCAYCETVYGSTMPVDVEHFRPKAKVVIGKNEEVRGYYWLAGDWNNLLPSCIDCNRSRTQKDAISGNDILLGKANQFPLGSEEKRWTRQKRSEKETRLLINPCEDDPAEYLQFTDEGIVRPQPGLEGEGRKRAEASIRVYGLNRVGLVQARQAHLFLILDYLHTAYRIIEAMLIASEEVREILDDVLLTQMAGLHRLCAANQPYAQMSRQLITKYWKELFGVEFELNLE